jgi:TRAP-type C4-dicarboxylate transport system permease small subunit
LLDWIRRLFSEDDGVTPSSSRVLMFIFSIFSIWLDWRIFYHVFRIQDTTAISVWLGNLPMLIGAEIGLIAMPYTVNKGTSTLSDVAGMFANLKANSQVNTVLSNSSVQAVIAKVAPKTGSAGPKG